MVEAKAKAKARGLRGQGQGHKILSSRCTRGRGQSSRTPVHVLFLPHELRRERLCQVVCLSITLKFNALLPPLVHLCMNYEVGYCIYGIESFTYHTQKFNVLRPDLEAKVKAAHRRGQGQGSSRPRPRPQNFVLELSSRSRPVLEDPIPAHYLYPFT